MSGMSATLISNKQVPSPSGSANRPADFLVYNHCMISENAPVVRLMDYALSHLDKSTSDQRAALILHHRQHMLGRQAELSTRLLNIPRTVHEADRDYEYDELIGEEL